MRTSTLFLVSSLALGLLACQKGQVDEFLTAPEVTSKSTSSVGQVQADLFNGVKPRVAVMDFDNKSGVHHFYSGKAVGDGMNEQLVTALMDTGAFTVLERAMLDDVVREQDMNNSDRFRTGGATPMGQLEGADFLIYGAVTEVMESQAGAGLGVVSKKGRRNAAGILEGVNAAFQQDHVAIDLRLVDARTGQVVSATSVEGKARDLGANLGVGIGSVLVGASGNYRTPIQKSIRACMIKAVNWVGQRISDAGIQRGPGEAAVAAQQAADDRLMLPVAVSGAKVRMKPSPDSLVLQSLEAGQQIEVLDEEGDWIHVRMDNGRDGWMARSDFGN